MSRDTETYTRFDEQHEERAYKSEEVLDALIRAGFEKIDIYDGYSFKKANEETQRLVYIAR